MAETLSNDERAAIAAILHAKAATTGDSFLAEEISRLESKLRRLSPLTPAAVQVGDWVKWGNTDQHWFVGEVAEVEFIEGYGMAFRTTGDPAFKQCSWIKEVRR